MKRGIGVLLLSVLLAVPTLAVTTPTEWSGEPEEGQGKAEQMRALHRALTRDQVDAAFAVPIVVAVPAAELATLAEGQAQATRLRVGLVRSVQLAVDLGGWSKTGAVGALRRGAAGFVWTAVVTSPGAAAIRLHVTDLSLPAGSELYVYGVRGEVSGPYAGRGELWTRALAGEQAVVQVRGEGRPEGISFTLAEVGYLTEKFVAARRAAARLPAVKAFCANACAINASCASIPPAVQPARYAVALTLFSSGGWLYMCSGGLLADTDFGSEIPYFLTANHCLSRSADAASMEAFFQYWTPCGGACDPPPGPTTVGATLLSTGTSGDYTLLRLDEPAPAGSAFLGWNIGDVSGADGALLYRISHPGGLPQAYSVHQVDTGFPTCASWPRGDWIYSRDLEGAPGSAGAPAMNAAGEVVGQHSGLCGYGDPCDAASNATVDGAFASYFHQIMQWLDPGACLPKGARCSDDAQCCSGKCGGPPGNGTCR